VVSVEVAGACGSSHGSRAVIHIGPQSALVTFATSWSGCNTTCRTILALAHPICLRHGSMLLVRNGMESMQVSIHLTVSLFMPRSLPESEYDMIHHRCPKRNRPCQAIRKTLVREASRQSTSRLFSMWISGRLRRFVLIPGH
jgi:hypothetical protein